MDVMLFALLLAPLAGALVLALPWRFSESRIRGLSLGALGIAAVGSLGLAVQYLAQGLHPHEVLLAKVTVAGHLFPVLALVDGLGLSYLGVTQLLGLLVVTYSHGYLHREKGFQRFFAIILSFIFGMQLIALAGHLDLFFAGWEIVGMSSFLLISFYRSYSRSVTNATRVYLLYRLCDMGLLLGAVLGHIFWHEASRFSVLGALELGALSSASQGHLALFTLLLIFASMGKSAQFPFHTWPARAMEGPTPSSAIFYGALSIHAGVFLLLRTQPLWRQDALACALIGGLGTLTLLVSLVQAGTQTNIKGQISYAITGQLGLMYVELALGLSQLVMVHLVCHALYRCAQLLVSPSIVANSQGLDNRLIRQRLQQRRSWADALPERWQRSLYALAMTDFSLDLSWRGFRFLGWPTLLRFGQVVLSPQGLVLGAAGLALANLAQLLPLAVGLGAFAVLLSLRSALLERRPLAMMAGQVAALALCALAGQQLLPADSHAVVAYFLPVAPFALVALAITYRFRGLDLAVYHAQGLDSRVWANLFMLAFFVLSGMPVSSAFVGEDMLLEELLTASVPLTALVATVLMLSGTVCVLIYTRLFMGRRSGAGDS